MNWALVAHTCDPSYYRGWDQKDGCSKPAHANRSWDLILKIPNPKRTGRVASVIGHLSSKCEALNSNPSTTKTQNKKRCFLFLVCINCTKGFRCDISTHAYNVLWSNSPYYSFLILLPPPFFFVLVGFTMLFSYMHIMHFHIFTPHNPLFSPPPSC
jgi:hypothetical protein